MESEIRQPVQDVQVDDMGNGFRVFAHTRCVGLDEFWTGMWHGTLFASRDDAFKLAQKVRERRSINAAHWTQRPDDDQPAKPLTVALRTRRRSSRDVEDLEDAARR